MKKLITILLGIAILIPNGKAQFSKSTNLIPTPLPIVYKEVNTFYVLNGLDTLQRDKVWGINHGGIFIKKTSGGTGRWEDAVSANWFDIKQFAESMNLKGKKGSLPPLEEFRKSKQNVWKTHKDIYSGEGIIGGVVREVFDLTVEILTANGIEAEFYGDFCWCSDEYDWFGEPNLGAYMFNLLIGESKQSKYSTSYSRRIAVYF